MCPTWAETGYVPARETIVLTMNLETPLVYLVAWGTGSLGTSYSPSRFAILNMIGQ